MPITPQDYKGDAILGEQLEKLMEKEIRDRLKGDVPETLAHALCVMAEEIDALKDALAASNLGKRVAESLDAQTLKVGGVDVAESLASKQARIGSMGGPSQPVYFDANGNVQEIPVATGQTWLTLYVANANYSSSAGVANDYNTTAGSIKTALAGKQDSLPLTTDDPQDIVYNIRVAGARYANNAGRATSAASADEANTANLAGKANALNVNAAVGSGILPVYIGANGVPEACNVTTDDPQDVVANFRVVGARYANNAGVASDYNLASGTIKTAFDGKQDKLPVVTGDPQEVGTYNIRVAGAMYATRAGALDMSAAVGGSSLPVYFTSDGTPRPCSVTQRTIGGTSYEFVTIQAIGAYAAAKLNTDAGGVGSDGYGQPVYVYNGVPVAIALEAIDGANFVKIAAKLAYQASVALNANAVNGKKIVIGGYGGAADTIYFG